MIREREKARDEERGRRRGNDATRIDDGAGMEKVLGLVWVLGKLEKKKRRKKEEGKNSR